MARLRDARWHGGRQRRDSRDDVTRAGFEIRVVTHDGLLRRGPIGTTDDTVTVDGGTTLAEVLASLGIDRGLLGVATMDGKFVQLDAALQNDCVIHVYPLFGGG